MVRSTRNTSALMNALPAKNIASRADAGARGIYRFGLRT